MERLGEPDSARDYLRVTTRPSGEWLTMALVCERMISEFARKDVAQLLEPCSWRYVDDEDEADVFGIGIGTARSSVQIQAPRPHYEALVHLADWEKAQLLDSCNLSVSVDARPRRLSTQLKLVDNGSSVPTESALLAEVMILAWHLVATGTSELMINSCHDRYKAKYQRVHEALARSGVEDPNPFADLWDWRKKWSADLPKWQDRRRFVADLYRDLLSRLSGPTIVAVQPREPTGWAKVDRVIEKLTADVRSARDEEDYQGVGLFCRELLISLAQAVYKADEHPTADGVSASKTDAKRMLEAYIAVEFRGESNEATRGYVKKAYELSTDLQHRRTATFRTAALCAEATFSVANAIAILAGRRDPK